MADNKVIPIKGNDIFFTLGGKRVYHATNHQLNLDNDYEEYETKDTDGKVQVLSGNTGTAQCDSMCCVIGSTTDDMDTAAIIDAWKSGAELALSLKIGTITYNAPAWIQSIQVTAPVGQRATCSASFKLGTLTKATA
jgi:hypothetical protein